MKKISLKNLQVNEVEQLSKEQLKEVLGGTGGFTTTALYNCSCPGVGSGLHYTISAPSETRATGAANAQSYFDGGTGSCSCVKQGPEPEVE
ncbi:hypothetical protein [Sphingobacterium sp. GVS05A]|uniref:hypothetical protein n=1 Tax=Sphingobacterium sp. GVS05A TaxID=2862679 RepID=UPI001CBB69C8|nr:hypothetical protein [Sphingobacterium sp. GVS05A]